MALASSREERFIERCEKIAKPSSTSTRDFFRCLWKLFSPTCKRDVIENFSTVKNHLLENTFFIIWISTFH